MKVVKRLQFNNGSGGSCGRRDWEEFEYIDASEVPDIRSFFMNELPKFDRNCNRGGVVGCRYETKSGAILFGVYTEIHPETWKFFAVKGDGAEYEEVEIQQTRRICSDSFCTYPVFDLSVLDGFYQ